jgi:hypothetical protein
VFLLHAVVLVTFDSSVVQLRSTGWMIGGSNSCIVAEAGNFILHRRVQTGSAAHPTSDPMGIRDSFPEGKAAGA